MEMTYGGALVMPSSYVMMDEEEMMYLEGGYRFEASVKTVAKVADVIIAVAFGIGAVTLCVRRLIVMHGMGVYKALAKETVTRFGLYLIIGNVLFDVISTILDFTPGLGIALLLDYYDKSGPNDMVQF